MIVMMFVVIIIALITSINCKHKTKTGLDYMCANIPKELNFGC